LTNIDCIERLASLEKILEWILGIGGARVVQRLAPLKAAEANEGDRKKI
jgi:hypothetical protein